MQINEELFKNRYATLNEKQREAVDAIYGPVMVIAGPGTGKTEVLSMRIANLLRSDAQVQPTEILCLTYTDEATNAMRRRLVQVIGTAAHRVNICTFHAFCNNIIQSNSHYFSIRSMQPVTDLERTELLHNMLEELPQGHVLRKLSGNIYYDSKRLNNLFDLMKREHYSAVQIGAAIDEYIADLPNRDTYIYKRAGKGFAKGDLKQAELDDEIRRMNETRAAAELFDEYNRRMLEAGRYDFNDMILWVLDAFKKHPALLQSYQERRQFILVDEFQDTNGSQNELLTLLTSFWNAPNIFTVGDDDQSIYEFQGARIRNIIDFYERYREDIKIVVLPHNYRSSQAILDKASATIQNNQQRLIYQIQELNLDKNIVASSPRFQNGAETITPVVKAYMNTLHEEADIVMQVEKLQQQGVPLNEVAVLYAQHKQADNIISLMEKKGIPYSVKKPVNILDHPLTEQLLNLLRYLDEERKKPFSGEATLFEIMHAPYYGIAAKDIAMLSMYLHNARKEKNPGNWRMLLSNTILPETMSLKSAEALRRLGNNLDNWLQAQTEMPLPLLVEKLIYESGIVAYLLQTKNYVWDMQVLHTFFEYVKDAYGRNASIKIADLLRMTEQMMLEGIDLPMQKVVHNDNGVRFYTAHGAKGNEFEYVFLVGCTKNFWEDKRGGNFDYKLPDTITKTDDDADKTYKTEVARRLFYVALTRAKKHLQVSYPVNDNNGKELSYSMFIDEISAPEERVSHSVATADVMAHLQWAMQPVPEVRIELANHQWVEHTLQSFTMSATALAKYLDCPLAFYYESILRVPTLKSDALAFGSAIHTALERMFRTMKEKKGNFPAKEEVVEFFEKSMYGESDSFTRIQYERRLEQGRNIISGYYDEYVNGFSKEVEIEFKVPRYMLDGVPVTGKIDKIELSGNSCTIIDYKTGDPDRYASEYTKQPNDKSPNGGDYWRQMIFYKLLIENYQDRNWQVSKGFFDYIEKSKKQNKYRRVEVPFIPADEEIVRKQLKDSYLSIMNHEFDKGCGDEDCHWCNFAKKYELVRPAEVVEIDDV